MSKISWHPSAEQGLERATEKSRSLDETPVNELPVAMVKYLAARLTRASKHEPGRRGQKFKALSKRRGTFTKFQRRRQRQLASQVRNAKRSA